MKVNTDIGETIVYVIMCILSLGTIWFIRITLTMAIRRAIKD